MEFKNDNEQTVPAPHNSKNRRTLFFIAAGIALLLCLCATLFAGLLVTNSGGIRSSIESGIDSASSFFSLVAEVAAEFPSEGVNISVVNGKTLQVSFTNPSFVDESDPQADAREVADFLVAHYEEIDNFEEIIIIFSGSSGSTVRFTSSQSFSFAVNDFP